MESDSHYVIDGRSLGSIIKPHGRKLFNSYANLSDSDKIPAITCLNGIADLTDEASTDQKQLFNESEWSELKSQFTNNLNVLPRFKRKTLRRLKKLSR